MTIREDEIYNNVSIGWTTRVPRGNENPTPDSNRGNKAIIQSPSEARSEVCANTTGNTADANNGDDEATWYVVYQIVSFVVENGEANYLVRCHVYPKEDGKI